MNCRKYHNMSVSKYLKANKNDSSKVTFKNIFSSVTRKKTKDLSFVCTNTMIRTTKRAPDLLFSGHWFDPSNEAKFLYVYDN